MFTVTSRSVTHLDQSVSWLFANDLGMSKISFRKKLMTFFFYQFSIDAANDDVSKYPNSLGTRLKCWIIC